MLLIKRGNMNWERGMWAQKKNESDNVVARIAVAGDWVPRGVHVDLIQKDPTAVYGDLLTGLQACDLRIVNLECALIHDGEPIVKGGPHLSGSPACVDALRAVPFDVVCLANNHTLDYGAQGLAHTQALLDQNGLQTVGAGCSLEAAQTPCVVSVQNLKIGIVNFCEGEDCTDAGDGAGTFGWDIVSVIDHVQKLRNRVDVVLVIGHCGREYAPVPPPYVVKAFRKIAESGADAVIGHHPHVPQGLEVHQGVPIFYSLGNFVFLQSGDFFFRKVGYTVELDFSDHSLIGFQIRPYVIMPDGLRLLQEDDLAYVLKRLKDVSDVLKDDAQIQSVWAAGMDVLGVEAWANTCVGLDQTVAQLQTSPEKAFGVLRNLWATPAHRHFRIDGLTRLIQGHMGTAPNWAMQWVSDWQNLTFEAWQKT